MNRRVLLLVSLSACGGPALTPQDQWPALAAPAFAHQPRIAIVDHGSDQLSFVSDGATPPTLFGSLPVGDVPVELEGPHHLAADGQYIYYNLSNYVPGTGSGPHGRTAPAPSPARW